MTQLKSEKATGAVAAHKHAAKMIFRRDFIVADTSCICVAGVCDFIVLMFLFFGFCSDVFRPTFLHLIILK